MATGRHRHEIGVGPSPIGLAPRLGDLLFALRQRVIGSAVTGEGGQDVMDLALRFGVDLATAEDGHRRIWSNSDLASVLGAHPTPVGTAVISYAALRPEHPRQVDVVGGDAALKSMVDDVTYAWPALAKAGVSVPHHAVLVLEDLLTRPDALNRWGYVRLARSSAGGGVAPATPSGLHRITAERSADTPLVVSRKVGDGRSLNYHALIDAGGGVSVHPPSMQLVGTPGLALHPTQFCGNDFAAVEAIDSEDRRAADAAAGAAGAWLAGLGHRGLCGIDVAFGGGEVAVVDINPRLQASTWLLTEQAASAGRPCPGLGHLAALGFATGQEVAARARATSGDPPDLAQMILRAGIAPRGRAANGLYRRVHGRWTLRGRGAVPADLDQEDVLVTGVPDPTWSVDPGAVVGRIVSRGTVTDDGCTLNARGRELLALHRRGLDG